MELEADFNAIMEASADVDEFLIRVGNELRWTVLGAIVVAQDEYIRIIQSMCEKQMPIELRSSLVETIFNYVQNTDQEDIDYYRKTMTD